MRKSLGAVIALCLLVACGGSDGAQGPAGPPGPPGNGSGGDGGAGPAHAPAGVSFEDDDYAQGAISGNVTVQKASDESDVTSYAVYWGSSATDKLDLTPIFEVKTTGQDISFPYEGLVPPGATTLLAVAKNANGESATPVATAGSIDHYFVAVDVSAGAPAGSGYTPSIAIDTKNSKVVIATTDFQGNSKPRLFICNYDGTGCTTQDASAGQGNQSSSGAPSVAVDNTNGKILIATENAANAFKLGLFTCNLDGTSCTHTDLSTAAGQAAGSGASPSIAIDPATNQLWVAVSNQATSSELGIFHCALNGTGCAYHGFVGQGANSGENPNIAVDVPGNHLFVVGTNANNGNDFPLLVACAADGTACQDESSISATNGKALAPSVAYDPTLQRIFFADQDQTGDDSITLCDATRLNAGINACTPTQVLIGSQQSVESPRTSIVVDPIGQRVLMVAADISTGYRATLHRCRLDGTSCKQDDLSGGLGVDTGDNPQITIDPTTGRFFIATENHGGELEGNAKPTLIYLK